VLGILSEIAYPGIQHAAWPENCSYLPHFGSLTYHSLKQIRYDHCYAPKTISFLPICSFVRFLSLTVHSHSRTWDWRSENASSPHIGIERRDARSTIDHEFVLHLRSFWLSLARSHIRSYGLSSSATLYKNTGTNLGCVDHDSVFPLRGSFW